MFGPSSAPAREGVSFRVVHSLGTLLRRAAQDAQHAVSADGSATGSPSVEFSFLEVYNEAVYDLLNEQRSVSLRTERAVLKPGSKYHAPVFAREASIVPQGLERRHCDLSRIEEQVSIWLREGAATRTIGQTAFNSRSSR